MAAPIKLSDVDINKINIQKAKKNTHKSGEMFNIFHGTQRLEIEMPEMNAPFGAKVLTDYGCKISLPLSFDGMEENTSRGRKLKRAHAKLLEIQERIKALILASPAEYFNDKKKPEIYRDRIKNFVVPSEGKDGKQYADLFRVEIQKRNLTEKDSNKTAEELEALKKEFASRIGCSLLIDRNKQVVPVNQDNVINVLSWGTRLKPVLSFAYLWIMKTGDRTCTPKWFLTHGMITEQKSTGLDLNPDEDSDEELLEEEEEEFEDEMEVSTAQA